MAERHYNGCNVFKGGYCNCNCYEDMRNKELNVLKEDNARLSAALDRIDECLPSNPDMNIDAMWACVKRISGIIRTIKETK